MGVIYFGVAGVAFLAGRVVGHVALVLPAGLMLWIGTHGELEGDLEWVVGGSLGVVGALGVLAGAYVRRRAQAATGDAPSTQTKAQR